MHCWLLFHRELRRDVPEAAEVFRFQQSAAQAGIRLDVLNPRDFELIVDSTEGWSAVYQGRKLTKPDLIIPRTGSETSYFTLAVLRHFERQGIAMVNGPAAVEAVADKLQTLQILSGAGLPIPKTILGKFPVDVGVIERELGFPVVVKTLRGTRGNGVLLCVNREQFNDLATLLDGAQSSADFIFQEYVKASHGRDVRVLVINGRAVAAMERRSTDGSFKSNISLGGVGTAFEPPPAMAELAVRVANTLGLDVAGVDILLDADGYRICEANSSPGFQGLEKACRISVPDAIFSAMRDRLGLPTSVRRRTSWQRLLDSLRNAVRLDSRPTPTTVREPT
ncbi:ATP-grasp domain-containing protein [Peristeroidobacter agariperforans]|uniref:ATP-grasp domain-containing protein n=1 Tax=Peristeroidobacter agariperforans TaxID=268404 RepID=UPI00101BF145|nr:RimK family alpha-L-glutamate ligase [Peristeroidobacter agariperforans]